MDEGIDGWTGVQFVHPSRNSLSSFIRLPPFACQKKSAHGWRTRESGGQRRPDSSGRGFVDEWIDDNWIDWRAVDPSIHKSIYPASSPVGLRGWRKISGLAPLFRLTSPAAGEKTFPASRPSDTGCIGVGCWRRGKKHKSNTNGKGKL